MVDAGTALRRSPTRPSDSAGGPRVAAPLSVSVLEGEPRCPGWVRTDPAWSPMLLGWACADGRPVAASLVLRRSVPGSGRFLALLPEPPRLGGLELEASLWRPQAVSLLRALGAFAVRIGLGSPSASHGAGRSLCDPPPRCDPPSRSEPPSRSDPPSCSGR